MASGLILFTYIGAHLLNHALGLISLGAAEAGMEYAVEVWYSLPGTILLYGAFATHFLMALIAVYERRTFRLPPLELRRPARKQFAQQLVPLGSLTMGATSRGSECPP